jgi:6-phosphogluconolactonase (cycloisomerase 2 family)
MRRFLVLVWLCAAAFLTAPVTAFANGHVYTSTNDSTGNAVQVLHAGNGGRLYQGKLFSTGGTGSGAGLGSQGAVSLAGNGKWLLAVNAGSNSLTVFRVTGGGLHRTDIAPSHGAMPISVAERRGLVYVVNTGSASIAGFWLRNGHLSFVPGSTRSLSAPSAGPAEIAFRPGGGALVVTEKATNLIDTFRLRANGAARAGSFVASSGQTPFGFAFAGRDTLVVSEAFGGAAGASATSSYNVDFLGHVSRRSESVANGQSAACWVATTAGGRYAFVANTGSGTVSSYRVGPFGGLSLVGAEAGSTGPGSAPADEALGQGDRFLYVLDNANQRIHFFRVSGGARLHALGSTATASGVGAGLAAS